MGREPGRDGREVRVPGSCSSSFPTHSHADGGNGFRAFPFGYVKWDTWWCLQGYLGAAVRYQSAQVMQGSWQAVGSTAVHCKFWQSSK